MNSASPTQSAATFFGGVTATVLHEDGSTESVKVRQLPLRDYQSAWPLLDDEIALTAFCCQRTADNGPLGKDWILTLQPESYEHLVGKSQEVNAKGFFSYARRHQEKAAEKQRETYRSMAELPEDTVKMFAEMGGKLPSPNSAPRPRPISK